MNELRRHTLHQFLALGLIGSAGVLGLIRDALSAGNDPIMQGMRKVRGEVRINGKAAHEGQVVNPGDQVTTGPDGEATYVIGKDAFLQRGNSIIRFGKDAAQDFFRVVSGRLLSVFGPGEKKLLTPTAAIGIRGTACYIEAESKKVYFCLCYGVADVYPTAEPGRVERIVTKHHDHPIYLHDDTGMPSMVGAEVVNHTDAELIMLEGLTGRKPPFYDPVTNSYLPYK
jgi:hypothetical protein